MRPPLRVENTGRVDADDRGLAADTREDWAAAMAGTGIDRMEETAPIETGKALGVAPERPDRPIGWVTDTVTRDDIASLPS